MPAILLDGKQLAQRVLADLVPRVQALAARDIAPKLTVVRVGDDPASKIYIRAKIRACEQAGVLGDELELPTSTPQAAVLDCLDRLNADSAVSARVGELDRLLAGAGDGRRPAELIYQLTEYVYLH